MLVMEESPRQIPRILYQKNNRYIECKKRGYRGLQREPCMQEETAATELDERL